MCIGAMCVGGVSGRNGVLRYDGAIECCGLARHDGAIRSADVIHGVCWMRCRSTVGQGNGSRTVRFMPADRVCASCFARVGITVIGVATQPQQLVKALAPDLRLHHHAGPAAHRRIIHRMVHVVGPVAQIVRSHMHQTVFLGLAEQREPEHVEIFGEHADDIDIHKVQDYLQPGWLHTAGADAAFVMPALS